MNMNDAQIDEWSFHIPNNTELGGKNMETLYTERLTLRKMELEDADVLCQYWSDPEVTKYMNITLLQTSHRRGT